MWRPIKNLIDVIPESNWDYFRKQRFPARLKIARAIHITWMLNLSYEGSNLANIEGFRVGKIYKNSHWHSVNIIPINNPARWASVECDNVEIFITEEQWNDKIFVAIFAAKNG